MHGGWVYILTNRKGGVLSTGVTADIAAHMAQHRAGTGESSSDEDGLPRLVHVEWHDSMDSAVAREKAIKTWRRAWKVALIEAENPDWNDRWFEIHA